MVCQMMLNLALEKEKMALHPIILNPDRSGVEFDWDEEPQQYDNPIHS